MVFHILAKLKTKGNIYPLIFHDIMRVIIMQVSTHLLFYFSHHNIPLFSQYLFETLMFMVASLCVYWFCFYTLFPVEWDIEEGSKSKLNKTRISIYPGNKQDDNSSYDNTTYDNTTIDDMSDNRSDDTPSVITLS